MSNNKPVPDAIMHLGLAFWGSKALLTAVELDLFTTLASGPVTAETLTAKLRLQQRGTTDWLDALVSLGMLRRSAAGEYANTPATSLYLDRSKSSYLGGMLEMANDVLYPSWGSLTEALRTGQPQNRAKAGQDFLSMYQDQARLRLFLQAMTGLSLGAAAVIAEKFPWDRYHTVIDIGAAEGCVPAQLALRHPHLTGGGFDLPAAGPAFDDYVAACGLASLRFYPGDFFADPLPLADVLVMGHILHDWSLDEKLLLIRKAYDALPDGGALIVYDAVIDDDRTSNTFGLLMSVNMLIETQAGFDYTAAECRSWLADAGFRDSYAEPLTGPDSMVVGIK